MRFYFKFLFLCLIFVSCDEQFGNEQKKISQKIIEDSILLFPGSLFEQSSYVIDEVDLWRVKIENKSETVVTFYWQKKNGILYMIEGDQGPFDYDMHPPYNVISLSTAKFLGFEGYCEGVLVSWKFKRRHDGKNGWVYHFYLKDVELPIVINAANGDIL